MVSGESELKSKVPVLGNGLSLLDYLTQRFRYQNTASWTELIGRSKITVNGKPAATEQILCSGDLVCYKVVLREPKVSTDIKILHEEETFLVVDKPANLPSHADGNFIKNTLIYLLSERLKSQGYQGRLWLVHRLDRETSGVLLLAKSKEVLKNLMSQFSDREVSKEYVALVKGVVAADSQVIEGAIGRDAQSSISIKRAVVPEATPGAKQAVTEAVVLLRLKQATLLKIIPRSGRTNQIRVHLNYIGHPVVGDKLYGRSDAQFLVYVNSVKLGGAAGAGGDLEAERQLLHAAKLSFSHPLSGATMTFDAPMPQDMEEYIDRML